MFYIKYENASFRIFKTEKVRFRSLSFLIGIEIATFRIFAIFFLKRYFSRTNLYCSSMPMSIWSAASFLMGGMYSQSSST